MKKLTLLMALAIAGALSAQVASEANSGYKTEQQRKQMAATLANPERDSTQKPAQLIRLRLRTLRPYRPLFHRPLSRMQIFDAFDQFRALAVQFTGDAGCGIHGLAYFGFQMIDSGARFGLLVFQFILHFDHARDALSKLRFEHLDMMLAFAQHVRGARHINKRPRGGVTGHAAYSQEKVRVVRTRHALLDSGIYKLRGIDRSENDGVGMILDIERHSRKNGS